MSGVKQSVTVQSGKVEFEAELDFATSTWSSDTGRPEAAFPASTPGQPEGEFPLTVHLDGKRYELYSDKTFAEVEGGLD